MALFTDTAPAFPREPRSRRRVGWWILSFALIGVTTIAFIPAPYVIEQPGPVYDTLGTVKVGGEQVPMIEIADATTYATDGELDMLTVTIEGNRTNLPSWIEVARAYLDPSLAVIPLDEVYPLGVTLEESNEQSRVDMENSQKEAIAAALTNLGYEFASRLTVVETQEGSPADGVLQPGDIIQTVNRETFEDVSSLRAEIARNGTEQAAEVTVLRDGAEERLQITPALSDGDDPVPIFGIVVGGDYDFPFEVEIQLESVGGPSAGMMFALGIIDKLTPGAINGGEIVAGTGTITATGEVGPIGGIRQKMYGATGAGADWFLAPTANCDEVTGHIPAGLTVFAVETLEDALAALDAIESGADTSGLPSCPVP